MRIFFLLSITGYTLMTDAVCRPYRLFNSVSFPVCLSVRVAVHYWWPKELCMCWSHQLSQHCVTVWLCSASPATVDIQTLYMDISTASFSLLKHLQLHITFHSGQADTWVQLWGWVQNIHLWQCCYKSSKLEPKLHYLPWERKWLL